MSKYLPHHRDHDFESIEECDGFYRSVLSILLIVGIIYALAVFVVEAWFVESQNQERYYSKPVTVTYEKSPQRTGCNLPRRNRWTSCTTCSGLRR